MKSERSTSKLFDGSHHEWMMLMEIGKFNVINSIFSVCFFAEILQSEYVVLSSEKGGRALKFDYDYTISLAR